MKNILLLTIIGLLLTMPAFAYEKNYIKNNKGQTTGYTKTYSNGKTVHYNKKGQVEYTYKKDSSGKVTKYSKTGRKLKTYK
jgi:hypothetical protein